MSSDPAKVLDGGTAPMAATWILASLSVISLFAVATMRDRTGTSRAPPGRP